MINQLPGSRYFADNRLPQVLAGNGFHCEALFD